MKANTEQLTSKGDLKYTEVTRLLFLGIPWPFTHFKIYDTDLVIVTGIINIKENDCYMYRVSDVEISKSLFQRIFGLSTVTCFTSDVTNNKIIMKNIKHGSAIKDFILQNSEKCRLMRRTVNMQNIGFGSEGAVDDGGIDDIN